MKIRPLHDWAVVKRVPAEEKSAGGIIIPDMAKEKPADAVIVAIGPGKLVPEKGKPKGKEKKKVFVPTVLKPGQRVIFVDYMAKDFEVDGVEITMIREEDVLGTYDEPVASPLVLKKDHPVESKKEHAVAERREHPVSVRKVHPPLVQQKPAPEAKKTAKAAPAGKSKKAAARPAKKRHAAEKTAAKKPVAKKTAKKTAPTKPAKKAAKPEAKKTARPGKKAAARKAVKPAAARKKPAAARKPKKK